ncbi:hypothetical protein HPB48_007506 [Haemaphysalis longicornis]|uniref:Protein kinase domain-containing protein n=1 Tax=Haemaphysalis longicornis TaxID=44386 RepID=A0A9J6GHD7_HAELO|nr:hypothetical protein HPB48_007506 [Haemaphysalis longicornis]
MAGGKVTFLQPKHAPESAPNICGSSLEQVNPQTAKIDNRRDHQSHLAKLVQGVIVRDVGPAVAALGRNSPFADADTRAAAAAGGLRAAQRISKLPIFRNRNDVCYDALKQDAREGRQQGSTQPAALGTTHRQPVEAVCEVFVVVDMSVARLSVDIQVAQEKRPQSFDKAPDGACLGSAGSLSPNLQPATPPVIADCAQSAAAANVCRGPWSLEHRKPLFVAMATITFARGGGAVIPLDRWQQALAGHLRLDGQEHVNQVEEVLLGESQSYVFFKRSYGDLHSYVRSKRRLRESEALSLFRQVAAAVHACHSAGVVLRDLKLRKFVFEDPERTRLKLETLEDAVVLEDFEDDLLSDKHGCPAYVSPEILSSSTSGRYSGRAADCWSLGVMLYTLLVGRYPFHDSDPSVLFAKIRRGHFSVPETLSPRARCLVRSLLRRDPSERLSAQELLSHPWFTLPSSGLHREGCLMRMDADQTVPERVLLD